MGQLKTLQARSRPVVRRRVDYVDAPDTAVDITGEVNQARLEVEEACTVVAAPSAELLAYSDELEAMSADEDAPTTYWTPSRPSMIPAAAASTGETSVPRAPRTPSLHSTGSRPAMQRPIAAPPPLPAPPPSSPSYIPPAPNSLAPAAMDVISESTFEGSVVSVTPTIGAMVAKLDRARSWRKRIAIGCGAAALFAVVAAISSISGDEPVKHAAAARPVTHVEVFQAVDHGAVAQPVYVHHRVKARVDIPHDELANSLIAPFAQPAPETQKQRPAAPQPLDAHLQGEDTMAQKALEEAKSETSSSL